MGPRGLWPPTPPPPPPGPVKISHKKVAAEFGCMDLMCLGPTPHPHPPIGRWMLYNIVNSFRSPEPRMVRKTVRQVKSQVHSRSLLLCVNTPLVWINLCDMQFVLQYDQKLRSLDRVAQTLHLIERFRPRTFLLNRLYIPPPPANKDISNQRHVSYDVTKAKKLSNLLLLEDPTPKNCSLTFYTEYIIRIW